LHAAETRQLTFAFLFEVSCLQIQAKELSVNASRDALVYCQYRKRRRHVLMCALLLSQSATWPNGAGRFFLNKINVFSFFKSDSTDMRLPRWNQIDTRLSDFTRRFPDPFVYDAVPLICGCTASEIASTRWVPFCGFRVSIQRLFQLPRRAHLSGYVTFNRHITGAVFFRTSSVHVAPKGGIERWHPPLHAGAGRAQCL
jgi:hypothetical protein